VANALSYLHHDCSPPIIHRDISSSNVLLDLEYEAHVSDFGTALLGNFGSPCADRGCTDSCSTEGKAH